MEYRQSVHGGMVEAVMQIYKKGFLPVHVSIHRLKMQRFTHYHEIPLIIMRGNGALLLYLLDY